MKKTVSLMLVLVLCLGILTGCNKQNSGSAVNADTTVTLIGDYVDTVKEYAGEVEGDDDTDIVLSSYLTGYKITEILVKAGDKVSENQIIAKIDTTDLNAKLSKAQSDYDEKVADAKANVDKYQEKYDNAKEEYDKAQKNYDSNKADLKEKMNKAEGELTAYKKNRDTVQSTYNSAKSTYDTIKNAYDNAVSQLSYLKTILDNASSQATNAQQRYYNAQDAWNEAYDGDDYLEAYEAYQELVKASFDWNGDTDGWFSKSFDFIRSSETEYTYDHIWYEGNYRLDWTSSAQGQYATAESNYNDARDKMSIPSMSLYGMDAIESALNTAKNNLDSAQSALTDANNTVNNAQNAYDSAKQAYDNYDNSINDLKNKVEDKKNKLNVAKNDLDKAKADKDEINKYNNLITLCDVRSPIAGVVYSINSEVGKTSGKSLMTIDNTNSLTVRFEISKEEAENQTIHLAMKGYINDDIKAVVYQCSMTADDDGKYYAYIRPVSTDVNSIKYGDKVTVSLATDSEYLYTVPGAAVGVDSDGLNYVLVAHDGEYYKVNVTLKGSDAEGNNLVSPQGINYGEEIAADISLVGSDKIHEFVLNTDLDNATSTSETSGS